MRVYGIHRGWGASSEGVVGFIEGSEKFFYNIFSDIFVLGSIRYGVEQRRRKLQRRDFQSGSRRTQRKSLGRYSKHEHI